ncbi:MarR family winged helix-turn-helix transcriptional regulator [Ktedonobacter robiniae]|uniref:MarR family transcriptional regulator n=1 Tax=Ktedonobacter robiniae TaxID=2778365 RepID=A0ABQ3V4E5_9CHLR|nr:helix-turn-helix domain-containing protein [Ktedonobacter robiniae]GHO59465.1 MarR family transcriptional regulator [Ktedonobacter robiniae]
MAENMSNDLHLSDYRELAEFRYQIRRYIHFSEQMARSVGLEPQQHQLLLAIKGLPQQQKPTIGYLAERLQIQHHSTVELVNRLVEREYVERKRDTVDQRRVLVQLTHKGEDVLQRLAATMLAELSTTGPLLVQTLNKLISQHG